jgi:xylulokinase
MAYILAHDLGTTGNKANLFDESGALVASHLESYDVSYPRIGWAEQNPGDWWRAVRDSTRALLQASSVHPRDIAAVTFSGQMMGVAALDARDRPLRSAIIWADVRAVEEANLIAERCDADEVYRRTGHRVSPSYPAAKMLWIKHHQPEIYAQARRFLLAKDYAALQLTGVAATDYSDASGTNLFDLQTRTWCSDFLDRLEIEEAYLPRICPSTEVVGQVTQAASDETGLAAGTPVVIGGGDGACATVGAGAVNIGDAYCVLGTSSWIAFTSDKPLLDPQQRTFTFHNLHPSLYMPTGTMQSACGARDWLIRAMGEAPDEQIAAVPAGSNGLIFLPYLIGERSPWWNPQARAAFVGLTMNHSSVEMSRAVLEGVAMNLKLILDAFTRHTSFRSLRLIGGGARSRVWQRILADVFSIPIEIPELLAEATSWGAAVAGGIGVGLYHAWAMAKAQTRVREVIEPDPHNVARYAELSAVFTDTYHALEPICARM